MQRLTVLYDRKCKFCRRVRDWLESEPKFLALELLARQSDQVKTRYPSFAIDPNDSPQELIVISDEGQVYLDTNAMIMCLYALRRFRALSLRLGQPGMFHLARGFFKFVGRQRHHDLFMAQRLTDEQLHQKFSHNPLESNGCETTFCNRTNH
jgi:predicted DCC family thiol-disulfide oxidoreductase YuxK